jgi:SAM-dependent methyltransferase
MNLESDYLVHPATIDACLQLALIASHGGNVESAKSAFVPVTIDSLKIWNAAPARYLRNGIAMASGAKKGPRGLYAKSQLFSETGEILMDMSFLKCISYQGQGQLEENVHISKNPFFRLCWKPDVDCLPDDQAKILFPVATHQDDAILILQNLEELATYMIISVSEKYRQSMEATVSDDHVNFVSWTHRYHARAAEGRTAFGLDALVKTHQERTKRIEQICESLGHDPEMLLLKRIYDNLPMILAGKISSAEIARNSDLLENIWRSSITFDKAYEQLTHLVDLCAHKNPHLRILEINAGMGVGPTGHLLSKLESTTDFKRYKDYTLTSKSPSFISGAQEKYSASKSVLYSVLDIDKDPQAQGFEAQYDLVIASRVLHATDVLSQTVQHSRKLLKPGGKLVVVEMTRALDVAGMLSGTFPGFWRGQDDGRPDGPFVEEARWHHEFASHGFSGIDLCLNDHPKGVDVASVIVTTATEPTVYLNGHATVKETIAILGNVDQPVFSRQLIDHLDHDRYHITYASLLESMPPQGTHVISLLDLEDTTNIVEDEASFVSFKDILRQSSSLLWLTKSDILEQTSPTAGLTIGLLRTIPREMPHIRMSQLCLGPDYAKQSSVIDHIKARLEDLVHPSSVGEAENYYALHKNVMHISRVVPDTLMNAQYRVQEDIGTDLISERWSELGPMKVAFGQAGLLSTLQFERDDDMHSPLPEDWVEIQSEAIEINMKVLSTVPTNEKLLILGARISPWPLVASI